MAGIKAQIGYKRRSGTYGGKPSVAVDNTLDRQLDVNAPDTAAGIGGVTIIFTHKIVNELKGLLGHSIPALHNVLSCTTFTSLLSYPRLYLFKENDTRSHSCIFEREFKDRHS